MEGRKRVVPIGSSCLICSGMDGVCFSLLGRWRNRRTMRHVRAPIGRLGMLAVMSSVSTFYV
jgi:hypothetical protein